jgi:nitrogen-specific signal transduction histidine kinase
MQETDRNSQTGYSTKKADAAFRILVVDLTGEIQKKIQEDIQSGNLIGSISLITATGPNEVLQSLKKDNVDIFIGVNLDPQIWYVTLELSQEVSAHTVTILLSLHWTEGSIREAVNRLHVFRALDTKSSREELRMHLHSAAVEASLSKSQQNLTKEAKSQNRELENLNQRLEKIVEERTLHLQQSKEEIDERLSQVRQMIRFVKDLSQNISFDELMTLVRKDFRRFSKLGDPLIILRTLEHRFEIMSYRGSSFSKTVFSPNLEEISFPKEIISNAKEVGKSLANHFGRPFLQLIAIPLEVRLIKKFGLPAADALLCVESSMNENEELQFLEHVQQILKPLSMAVDRLFLENELSTSTSRWEKTFDGLPDPIAIIDMDYNVLRSNNKFSDRVVQRKCYEVFASRSGPCDNCPLLETVARGEVAPNESSKLVLIKDRFYEVGSYPIKIESTSKVTTVVHQYVDVTQNKMLYGRMVQNEKMSAIGLLAGNIAHELNNPLSGIRSMTQILMSEVKDPQLLNDLTEIEKASKRSQIIIKNLLDFSTGSLQKTELISVDEIVEKTMPMLKALIRSYRNEVKMNTQNYLVEVDPQLMQQVVFNLINNAAQAMGSKGTLSLLSSLWKDTSQDYVQLIVKDTGPGIPPEIMQKIFEPFFTTKTEGHGTGLGLSLSRDIVRKFNGDILVQSAVGAGASFTIRLPAKKITESKPDVKSESKPEVRK